MKDSGIEWIGEIPEDWEIVKLKYTSDSQIPHSFEDGDWIESKYISEEGIRYLTTGNIGDGKFKEQGNGFVSKENFKILNCKYAYSGDLILSRLNAPYGRSCILPKTFDNYVIAVDNVILRPSSQYDKKFINYITQCSGYQKSVEDSASGTTMQRISRTKLGNIPLAFPDVETQKIISIFLNKKIKQIEDIKCQIFEELENLENYKKSVITESVTKGLDKNVEMKDSGIEWIGEIPKHWKSIKAKILFEIKDGTHDTPKTVEKNDALYTKPLITTKNIYKNTIDFDSANHISYEDFKLIYKRSNVEKYDLIMPMIGTIGSPVIVETDRKFAIKNVALLKMNNDKYISKYVYYQFHSSYIEQQMKLNTKGGVQLFISMEMISRLIMFVTNKEEVKSIVNYLDKKTKLIDDSIAIKQKQLETLEEYKKSLIYEYVTGKKEVKHGEET